MSTAPDTSTNKLIYTLCAKYLRINLQALEEVGLHTIEHYVQVRRQTIAAYIVDRTIFELCMDGRRRQGTIPRTYWWEQPMDLDLARGAFPAPGVADDED